ncbi:hypothetical protein DJ568_05755 [Mucilaginibacter hurinus]|uniref:DUF4468 domain-containing protein n=1 Tax=Mucilaginibacter hurinus TaxID=2201324 RepID=A0A367GS22_9SPHI|nr:DUF4468 domain-containing protein [Mucilaginibacter hurinus]RCH56237.1 hypothetical protein DJ568_05755 [Mucilaginibacter hurinus]
MSLVIGIVFPLTIQAQTIDKSLELPVKDSIITFEKVVNVDSTITKDQLFNAAMAWASAETTKVIKLSNPVTNQVGGWGTARIYTGTFSNTIVDVLYLFVIKAQNGRYQITLSDFTRTVSDGREFSLELKNYYRVDKAYIGLRNGSPQYDSKKEKTFFRYLNQHAVKTLVSFENFIEKYLRK